MARAEPERELIRRVTPFALPAAAAAYATGALVDGEVVCLPGRIPRGMTREDHRAFEALGEGGEAVRPLGDAHFNLLLLWSCVSCVSGGDQGGTHAARPDEPAEQAGEDAVGAAAH